MARVSTGSLGPWILQAFHRLRPGGGYRFTPTSRAPDDATNPRDPHYDGVRASIVVAGQPVVRGSDDGATYCCGVTFACWWEALGASGSWQPEDPAQVSELVAEWFCPTMGHSGVVAALVERGWGVAVDPREAEPGDLVQYWRRVELASPSGHSAIWLGLHDGALRYASSQPATDGVGIHTERVGEGWQVHVVRPLLLDPGGSTTP